MILEYEKSVAEDYVGHAVTDAVITVPAYFNDGRRKATIEAGLIAKLNVLQILSEPTAACLAYGFWKTDSQNRTILVFDLGGGTFDVSVVFVTEGAFEVLAVSGDPHLGGDDFDRRIVDLLVGVFARQTGLNVTGDPRGLAKLRRAATRAKIDLSEVRETRIEIDHLMGTDFVYSLRRAGFEEVCQDLFEKIIPPLKMVIDDSKLSKSDIDDIVLVGGSTRIPRIRELVREFLDGRELTKNINPDEAVALGAALRAAMLIGAPALQQKMVIDVAPLSLGLEIQGRRMHVIIPRNTRLPAKKSESYTTTNDYQEAIAFEI
jgi:molecular chaperone DnaK (HSP70)